MKNDMNENPALSKTSVMQRYEGYKKAFPNKTDAQCIESLCYEVSDKVETIHSLLKEIERLKNER